MAVINLPDWVGGTITLTAGQTGFSVSGVDLTVIDVQPGDQIYHTTTGRWLIIGAVTGTTTGDLAYACPADLAGTGLALRIRYQPDVTRMLAALQKLQALRAGGNLDALAGLTGAPDTGFAFNGAGTMFEYDLPSIARDFLAADFMPVEQGTHKIKIDWNSAGYMESDIDNGAALLGRIWADFEAGRSLSSPAGYQKFPGGFVFQWTYLTNISDVAWTFPVAFPTECLGASAIVSRTLWTDESQAFVQTDTKSVNTVNIRVRNTISGLTDPRNVSAFAWGH